MRFKIALVIICTLAMSFNVLLAQENNTVIVYDTFDIPMVFVPSGEATIGAELLDVQESCERLADDGIVRDATECVRRLANTVPEGIDWFVTPRQTVTLSNFFIDQTEVSIAQYQACVEDDVCSADVIQYLRDFSPFASVNEAIRYISYTDAETYCEWRGGFLPSATEWEYTARGNASYDFAWGNEFDGTRANFCDVNCLSGNQSSQWDDGYAHIAPVDAQSQDISWVGALGMTGNVAEWTSSMSNIRGNERVTKGGFYGSLPTGLFLWRQLSLNDEEIREGIGFRCAKRL
ncbi:MAG: SUMF1/EgtB/PvdO family nonheme iron enzyme [Chloroflexota bacterium]